MSAIVSRKDIFAEEDESYSDREPLDPKSALIDQLHDLIFKSLGSTSVVEQPSRKRQKIQINLPPSTEEEEEEPICARFLVVLYLVLFKCPNHLHHLCQTREPETEDNKTQAVLRKERAQATAVDASHILEESRMPIPPPLNATRKFTTVKATNLSILPPAIVLLEHSKSPRSTRPPVPAADLRQHPYNNGSVPTVDTLAKCPVIPVVSTSSSPVTTKRKRRRRVASRKERPPPAFWRPNPAVGGKSLGYGMGFPCSVNALLTGSDAHAGYDRDGMRTCRYPESWTH
ncbi:hypothetical protein DXG03_004366 [Asterophora parasitica]|uniref:Uncharacterized protein n=1 Tax=Asterophora parasitica TaxID=117018 RepID=A0A9P7G8Q7_9AGAR|nr:hypothetical protein DXG03_004366 [Asterophora parasitica]